MRFPRSARRHLALFPKPAHASQPRPAVVQWRVQDAISGIESNALTRAPQGQDFFHSAATEGMDAKGGNLKYQSAQIQAWNFILKVLH